MSNGIYIILQYWIMMMMEIIQWNKQLNLNIMTVKEEKQLAMQWWKTLPDSEKELVCAMYYHEHVDHRKVNATKPILIKQIVGNLATTTIL